MFPWKIKIGFRQFTHDVFAIRLSFNGLPAEVHSYGLTLRTPAGRGLLYVTELDEYVEARDSSDSVVGIGLTASVL